MASVLSLVPLFEPVKGDKPWWLVLGWPAVESGGSISQVDTSIASLGGEASLFQLSADERKLVGADLSRLTSDPAYSVQMGLALIDKYADKVRALSIDYGTDLFWWFCKLVHGIGAGGVEEMVKDMRAHGEEPSTMAQVTDYFSEGGENDDRVKDAIKARFGSVHYPSKWIANANAVYAKGVMLAIGANLLNPKIAIPLVGLAAAAVIAYVVFRRRRTQNPRRHRRRRRARR